MKLPICANCDAPLNGLQKIYCSVRCREFAKAIRWARAQGGLDVIREIPDQSYAYEQKLKSLLSGGYATLHNVSPKTRAFVIKRDQGRCRGCGSVGTEIDHIHATEVEVFNLPENLQFLCFDCHRAKTEQETVMVRLTPTQRALRRELEERIARPQPLRPCDDSGAWGLDYWRMTTRPDMRAELAAGGFSDEQIDVLIRHLLDGKGQGGTRRKCPQPRSM